MLPATFQTPAAIVLLLGGLLACFAGYRVFRIVLAIYGFILGALVASSFMGTEQTLWMILTWIAGGVAGALILLVAYFAGVALLGAGIGAGAALSFLGFGAPPPAPEWGAMLAVGRNFLANAWWLVAAPGAAITLTVLAITALGREGIRRSEGVTA